MGVIADYDPFHQGHLMQIAYAREVLHARRVIVTLNGNFTQRGFPAVASKEARAQAAVNCGADAVFEIPVAFSTSPIDSFAWGAVSLLDALGCIDVVLFGSESGPGHARLLATMASAMAQDERVCKTLRSAMARGIAEEDAFACGLDGFVPPEAFPLCIEALGQPNNILGILYIFQAIRSRARVRFATNPRVGQAFFDDCMPEVAPSAPGDGMERQAFAAEPLSASCIRRRLFSLGDDKDAQRRFAEMTLPRASFEAVMDDESFPVHPNRFSAPLMRALRERPHGMRTFFPDEPSRADGLARLALEAGSYAAASTAWASAGVAPNKATRILTRFLLGIEGLRPSEPACCHGVQWTRLLACSEGFSLEECAELAPARGLAAQGSSLLTGAASDSRSVAEEIAHADACDNLYRHYVSSGRSA
ncbi:MAG TPA: nucleotidyltransferase family protein [Candidatus Coprousia avicola]|nr:nucleotidyltransferase family protein [Candidatus Coprousia avicola]